MCENWGSHCGVAEDLSFLVCDAMLLELPSMSKGCIAFIFGIKQFKKNNDPLKCCKPRAQGESITFQKAWILKY